jgi:hypothetical protein
MPRTQAIFDWMFQIMRPAPQHRITLRYATWSVRSRLRNQARCAGQRLQAVGADAAATSKRNLPVDAAAPTSRQVHEMELINFDRAAKQPTHGRLLSQVTAT